MSRDRDWPLFGLWIETPRLTLRYPTDDDLAALNSLAGQGIHDPALMPFDVPWTDDPPEIRPQHSLQFYWGLRASWTPTNWHLSLMVKEGETVVGAPRDKPVRQIRLLLSRETWEKNPRHDIQMNGLEPCLPMFGVDKKTA